MSWRKRQRTFLRMVGEYVFIKLFVFALKFCLFFVQQQMSYHGGQWRNCVFSWLSHTNIDTTFLSKATDCFLDMHLRREGKNCRKENLQVPAVRYATRLGSNYNFWSVKLYGLADQKLCYFQMLLSLEKKMWRTRLRISHCPIRTTFPFGARPRLLSQ